MVVVVVVMVVVAMVMRPTYPPISEKLWYLAGRARNLPRHDEEGNIVGARARKPRGTHRINFHPFFLVGWGGESDFYNAVTLVYSDFRRC